MIALTKNRLNSIETFSIIVLKIQVLQYKNDSTYQNLVQNQSSLELKISISISRGNKFFSASTNQIKLKLKRGGHYKNSLVQKEEDFIKSLVQKLIALTLMLVQTKNWVRMLVQTKLSYIKKE